MTELDPATLRRELLLQNSIEKQLDTLVRLATIAVLKLPKDTRMEESQLRNLLNAALESKSIEVTTNFVRYQIARKDQDWNTSLQGFGHTVIKDIAENIKKMADGVILSVIRHLENSPQEKNLAPDSQSQTSQDSDRRAEIEADIAWFQEHRSNIHVQLTQLYLGYINRVFYFYKKSIDRNKREPQSNALQNALTSLELVIASSKEVKAND